MDISYFSIESLVGTTIAKIYSIPSNAEVINITKLKCGTYRLYAHSAKRKVKHKVGYFFIKR